MDFVPSHETLAAYLFQHALLDVGNLDPQVDLSAFNLRREFGQGPASVRVHLDAGTVNLANLSLAK